MSCSRLRALFLAAFLGSMCPTLARAADPGQRTTRVTLVGFGNHSQDFERLLAEWNSELAILEADRLQAGEIFDSREASELRIWIVWLPGWGASIYFADPDERRFLLREVPLGSGLDEAGLEVLAQVIATTTTAFVGRQVKSTRAEVLSSLASNQAWALRDSPQSTVQGQLGLTGSVRTRAKRREPAWESLTAVYYAAQLTSSDTVAHGPGIVLGTTNSGRGWSWTIAAQGQYQWPLRLETQPGTLTLRSWNIGVVAATERTVSSRWTLGPQLGFFLAGTTFGLSEISRPNIEATPTSSHFWPQLQAALRSGHDFATLRGCVLFGIGTAFLASHYDLAGRPLFTPWIVTPRIGVELAWR